MYQEVFLEISQNLPALGLQLLLCFHNIGSFFGLFRNDPSHFAVQ